MSLFSFKEYQKILRKIKSSHATLSFRDCKEMGFEKLMSIDKFVIMRHDIEASIDNALEIAKLDSSENISSSFFFLLTGDYNIFSEYDSPKIRKIVELGHDIGLHYDASFLSSLTSDLSKIIIDQSRFIESFFDIKTHAASCHKPMRYGKLSDTGDLINPYDSNYMTQIKYISDSNQAWREGGILKNLDEFDKIQLLTHDICWSKDGLSFDDILMNDIKATYNNIKSRTSQMISDMHKGLKMRNVKDKEFQDIYMSDKDK